MKEKTSKLVLTTRLLHATDTLDWLATRGLSRECIDTIRNFRIHEIRVLHLCVTRVAFAYNERHWQ